MVCTGTPEKRRKGKGKNTKKEKKGKCTEKKEEKRKKAKQTSAEGAGRVPRGQGCCLLVQQWKQPIYGVIAAATTLQERLLGGSRLLVVGRRSSEH